MLKTSLLRKQPDKRFIFSYFMKPSTLSLRGIANEFFEGVPLTISSCTLKMWNGSSWISVA